MTTQRRNAGRLAGRFALAPAAAGALLVAAIFVNGQPPRAGSSAPLKAEQLAMVDCLLPAAIRQLGGMMTYLGPREPVKSTASECEIRGGEYVAYDRANFATAFQVWLPKAKDGDAQAQTYVGEIYEKGMGMPSDYAKAAEWYRKAADQGFVKAQSNLAYLYEQGLGVPKDPVQALNWYRKSSGIVDDDLTFVSEVTAVRSEMQSQIDALSTQLEEQNTTADALRRQVDESRKQVLRQTARLAAERRESEQLKARIADLQAAGGGVTAEKLAELQKAQADLKVREQQLGEQEAALATLKRSSAGEESRLADQLAAAAADAAKLRQQLGEKTSIAETAQSQLAAANARLAALDDQVRQLKADTKNARERLAAAPPPSPAAKEPPELAVLRQKVAAGEQAIASLQATRKQFESQAAELARTAAANQQQLQSSRAQIASLQQRAQESDQRLADANRRLLDQEQLLIADRGRLASAQANTQEMRALAATLAEREAKLGEQRSIIAGLQAETDSYRTELGRLKAAPPVAQVASVTVPVMRGARVQVPPEILGAYHALIIGNNSYKFMPNLTTAVSDADAVANILKSKYGFETRVLHNATNDEIMGAINEYRKTLRASDNLLIYYAGHGELDEKNYRGYWLPVNAKRDDTTAWISDQMITDQLNGMSARHVMVVADSCYAGAMTRSGGIQLVSKGGDDAEARRLKYLAGRQSRTVLTSGGVAPVVDGGPGGNSIFARALIEALEHNDRVLEGAELYNDIFDVVRSSAKRLFKVDQSPVYAKIRDAGHQNGEFLFVPRSI